MLDALGQICPARAGSAPDAVGGVVPAYVALPGNVDETASIMRLSAENGLTVVPRGSGSEAGHGPPPRDCDLVVDMSRMDGLLEHAAGDLICRVQAGAPLSAVQDRLAPAGQQLAIEGGAAGSTVGGTIATAASGPLRLRYGTPRDLLIGITVVRGDGAVARSGGKVVKNVAGYDLGKLYTGSFGTLGVIADATFRLHPIPDARRVVTCQAPDESAAYEGVRAILGGQLMPSALEIDRPSPGAPVTLAVLLEGQRDGTADRAGEARELLEARTCGGRAHEGSNGSAAINETPPGWWAVPLGGVRIKLTAEIAALPRVLRSIDEAARRAGLQPSVRGSAGAGVLRVGLAADVAPANVALLLDHLRPVVGACGGSAVVESAPAEVQAAVDPWGPVDGLSLMRRVKDQFDPEHRLSPGRFVGGI